MTDLGAIFGPEAVAALERLVDERVRDALATTARPAPPPPSEYMTVAEAMQLLRCSRQRVDDLLSSRRLTRYKEGGSRDHPRSGRTLLLRAEVERLPWRAS